MTQATIAVIQMSCAAGLAENLDRAEALVREAAGRGAGMVLLPELFHTPYFCQDEDPDHFQDAAPVDCHPILERMAPLAAELEIVLPISFFEQAGQAHFNSVMIVDADGRRLGVYRKTHIPDGPGYQEKYYFNPGDTGFRVWPTRYGRLGVGICWDQWFPEAARVMALAGADILLFPTAIGSEPADPDWDSRDHWQRVMQGHAAANLMPLAAANRLGLEIGTTSQVTFHGSSFITGPTGEILAQAGRTEETIITASFDFDLIRRLRASWGVFRDRRPEHYGPLLTLDGKNPRRNYD